MRSIRMVVCLGCFLALSQLISCGGSSSSDAPGVDPVVSVPVTLADAKAKLADGDIAGAYDSYSAIIGDGLKASIGKVSDPENSEARFGRAFTALLLLIERDPSTALLAGFGQEPWQLSTVFGQNGILAQSYLNPPASKADLPFYNVRTCRRPSTNPWIRKNKWRCALGLAVEDYTADKVTSSANDLMAFVDPIISDLLVAIDNPSASYVIPRDLYTGDINISVNHSDMVLILSGLYAAKAASDFSNSWTFTIDLSDIVDVDGTSKVTKSEMVDRLNDAQFALRSDHKLDTAETSLQNAAKYAKQGVDEVLDGASGGVLKLSTTNDEMYQNFSRMADALVNSFSGDASIVDIDPAITANLDNLFRFPPNVDIDPFVYENGKIRAVEAFWQEMITSACDFTIGTRGVKVFSSDFRLIRRPYYQLFNTIMGHRFGKYKAGRGA